jgi:very-short-patch-repair endonuclease
MARFSRTRETTLRARSLSQNMTVAEWKLWYVLRGAGMGVSFRRQHPIGPYFVDFYCAPLKLAIELDGGQHAAQGAKDAARTRYLNAMGVEVLRFWNIEVAENLDGVCRGIAAAIAKRDFLKAEPHPLLTSPLQGEECIEPFEGEE